MHQYRMVLVAAALSLTYAACSQTSDENPPMEGFNLAASDARAIEIADEVMRSMGGRTNWDQTRYLSWSFHEDDQVWDKWTGRFRWQRDSVIVLMNVDTKEGDAWVNDTPVMDSSKREEYLRAAYGNWVNSSYWLLLPFKLKDSGVTLRYMGEGTMENGRIAEVLSLTFEDVGLTPQNRYEVFVDKETMLVEQWSFFANADDAQPSFTRPWTNWQPHGTILLSADRGEMRDGSPYVLPNVGIYEALPESVFQDPAPLDLSTLGGG